MSDAAFLASRTDNSTGNEGRKQRHSYGNSSINAASASPLTTASSRTAQAPTAQQRQAWKLPSTTPPRHAIDSITVNATCKKLISVLALDAGFEGITASALEALTSALENYTQQLYSIAHSFAELAGRTRPNIHDLQQAFVDMNLNPASLEAYVRKASQSKTPLLRGPLQETIAKGKKKQEKTTLLLDSDIEDNSDSDEEEPATTAAASGTKVTARTAVPDHLPPFPSKHSYKQTPVFVKRPTDPQKIRELNAEQSRLVESNLKRLMAAENKVAMTAAAHKDGTNATAADLLMVKEEKPESSEAMDRRILTKLEALPVVNYELLKRQQQLSTVSNRKSTQRLQQVHELQMQGGQLRGESAMGTSGTNLDGSGAAAGSATSAANSSILKTEWRKERRRMRKERQAAMEELEQNLNHKRLRQESSHAAPLKLISMDIDSQ
ncbi:transcription initiation factor TFIID subunit 8 [Mortierella claussenii]|nr:transcription initiation factor TFIID subunit 8 [Mortierella claussenii]